MGTIEIMGVKLPDKTTCPWCGKPESCPFYKYAYLTPCNECRLTPKYDAWLVEHEKNKPGAIENALKSNKPAAVFEGRGRDIVVNHKGDVIANVPHKERDAGKKDWGRF